MMVLSVSIVGVIIAYTLCLVISAVRSPHELWDTGWRESMAIVAGGGIALTAYICRCWRRWLTERRTRAAAEAQQADRHPSDPHAWPPSPHRV